MNVISGEFDHTWRFVTNDAHVLSCVTADPNLRLRDIALAVGITERTTAQIVNELEQAGYLTKTRDGRRNRSTTSSRCAIPGIATTPSAT
jgi:DNA-binding MarR family transcriptional regulator